MKHHNDVGGAVPSPGQLAAYVDGELDAAACRQVEAWLATHPEAAAEVEAQRRLADLWRATAPPEPSAAAWAALGERIAAGVSAPTRPPVGRRLIRLGLWGSAAAGLLLAWLTFRPPPHEAVPDVTGSTAAVEPYRVVDPEDVEIISIAAADHGALIVGDPPLREPLVMVAAGDVEVQSVDPAAEGMVPYVPAATAQVPNSGAGAPDRLP
jgi:hypothetical protein